MYVTLITIGRNRGCHPMSDVDWASFQDRVHEIASHAAASIESAGWDAQLTTFHGTGSWAGVEEESTIFQVLHDIEIDPGSYEIYRLQLKEAARDFNQECIALQGNARADLVPAAID